MWGSELRAGTPLQCARCFVALSGVESYVCQGCRATYGRACLATQRRCACGSERYTRHEPQVAPQGLFRALGAALWRVIHGSG